MWCYTVLVSATIWTSPLWYLLWYHPLLNLCKYVSSSVQAITAKITGTRGLLNKGNLFLLVLVSRSRRSDWVFGEGLFPGSEMMEEATGCLSQGHSSHSRGLCPQDLTSSQLCPLFIPSLWGAEFHRKLLGSQTIILLLPSSHVPLTISSCIVN